MENANFSNRPRINIDLFSGKFWKVIIHIWKFYSNDSPKSVEVILRSFLDEARGTLPPFPFKTYYERFKVL